MKRLNDNTLIIGPCRLSYMRVFAPEKNKVSDKDEYSVTLLIPKEPCEKHADPAEDIKAIKECIVTAAAAKFGADMKTYKRPLRDGDSDADGEPKHPGFWFMSAKAKVEYPPKLIDGAKREAKAADWQSGDWGMVKCNFFAYSNVNKGVSCSLQAIQFTHIDEHFGGGGPNTADEFDAIQPAAAEDDPFGD